jgi:L,D-peptidoglycan transpeptidase YkuD (ErfK/YbiS/YcfS/YnhG family)
MVRAPYAGSAETLRRADPLYDLVLITDWNWPRAQTGHGSAIFVHQWRKPRHPTEGCVAFSRRDLAWIVPRIRPETRLVVRDGF